MSENRFWFVIDKGKLDYVQDNVTGENITVTELEDLLNELYEERNYFERKKCEYWNKFNLAHLDNINLRKENGQLRKEVAHLETSSRKISKV